MSRTRKAPTPQLCNVYLIHFDKPLSHARHYLGSTTNMEARMRAHESGEGARLLAVLNEKGIGWEVVRTWVGVPRGFERLLKNRKESRKLCPVCNKKGWRRVATTDATTARMQCAVPSGK